MHEIKTYLTQSDGDYVQTNFNGWSSLKSNGVYIFEIEKLRRLFIWAGRKAPVRSKFVASQVASQRRFEMGMTFKVVTVEDGDETNEFLEALGLHKRSSEATEEASVEPSQYKTTSPSSPPVQSSERKVEAVKVVSKPRRTTTTVPKTTTTVPKTTTTVPKTTTTVPKTTTKPQVKTEQKKPQTISSVKELSTIPESVSVLVNKVVQPKNADLLIDSRLIKEAGKSSFVLTRIFVSHRGNSSSKSSDEIQLFEYDSTEKTTDCSNVIPVMKIFLEHDHTDSYEVTLHLREKKSLYYSCPKETFIALNFVMK